MLSTNSDFVKLLEQLLERCLLEHCWSAFSVGARFSVSELILLIRAD